MKMVDVKAELSGSVWKIVAAVGDRLAEDDVILILESMKMEIPVIAPADGVLSEIKVVETEQVGEGQTVAVMQC